VALALPAELATVLAELKPLFAGLANRLASVASTAGGAALQGAAVASGAALQTVGGAAADAAGQLNLVVATATRFVEAFDPSAVELMQDAFRDLQAVIGVALLPIIEVATDAFRQIGDVLLPVMTELQPVIRELANSVVTALLPVVQLLAQALSGVGAVMQFLGPIIETAAQLFRVLVSVVSAVIRSVAQALSALFGSSFTSLANDFKNALRQMVTALVVGVGTLAKFLGATDFLRNYIQALEGGPRGAAEGTAAITNVRQTSLPDLVKDLNLAAARATGGSEGGPEKDPLAEAVAELKRIAASTDRVTLGEVIASGVVEGFRRLPAQGAAAVNQAVGSHLDDWKVILRDLWEGGEIERRRPLRR
jgi:hypothetical protein